MRFMNKMVWVAFTLASFVPHVWAIDDLISSQLQDQARSWEQKDRNDMAADLWRKLLRTDPGHPEALIKLGLIEAQMGNIKEAKAIYNRASQLEKPPVGLSQLQAVLGVDQVLSKNPSLPVDKQEARKSATASADESVKTGKSKRAETTPVKSVAINLKKKNGTPELNAIPQAASPGAKEAKEAKQAIVVKDRNDLNLKSEVLIDPGNLARQH